MLTFTFEYMMFLINGTYLYSMHSNGPQHLRQNAICPLYKDLIIILPFLRVSRQKHVIELANCASSPVQRQILSVNDIHARSQKTLKAANDAQLVRVTAQYPLCTQINDIN